MSKLWHLYKSMPCCGLMPSAAAPIIDVKSQSTLGQEMPGCVFTCRSCFELIPSNEPVLLTTDGKNYLKHMYKPFNDGVEDEVRSETIQRSDGVQQVRSDLGHERRRSTAMQASINASERECFESNSRTSTASQGA